MRIALLGSTGYVGMELLKKCVERGHKIKVLVRDPGKLGELAKKVEVIEGDYFDHDKVAKTITDTELVISTIGPSTKRPPSIENYKDEMTKAMTHLVSTMEKENVKKIIIIGGAATPVKENEIFHFRQKFLKFILNSTAKHIISIKKSECAILAGSDLDWIIVRPPAVTKGLPTNHVKADEHILYSMKVSLEDLVGFVLEQTISDVWLHKAPLVCSLK